MLHLPFPNLPLPEHTRHRLELFHAIRLVLHERNTFALHCFHNNCNRHSLYSSCLIKSCLQLIHVISVFHIDHMEIKCFKLFVDRVWRTYVIYLTVDHEGHYCQQSQQGCPDFCGLQTCSLPDLTFLDLAVSQKSVYSVRIIA